jgi:hypothetical protein
VNKPLINISAPRGRTATEADEDAPRSRRSRRRQEPEDRVVDTVRPPSSGGLGIAASVLIGISLLLSVVLLGYELYVSYLQIRAEQNEEMAVRAIAWTMGSSPAMYERLWMMSYGIAFVSGIVFLCWVYKARSSLRYLQVTGLQNTPGWCVGSFFIPVVNLYAPCLAIQEIWRASTPEVQPDRPLAWAAKSGARRIWSWWICGVLSGLLPLALKWMRPGLTELMVTLAIAHVLGIVSGVALILTILGISRRQRLRHDILIEQGDSAPA